MYTRSSLPAHLHPTVDTILKQLKSHTRRLQNLLATHRDELAILNRLYYKGRNQHRTALFWQRVNELRRYARRVENAGISNLLVTLRDSFYGNETQVNTKVLRGSWTHLPPRELVVPTISHLEGSQSLVDKASKRYVETYKFFMLQMQNGAFLQLILTLVAINSRLAILMKEVSSTIFDARTVIEGLRSAVNNPVTDQSNEALPRSAEVDVNEVIKEGADATDDLEIVSFAQYQSLVSAEVAEPAAPTSTVLAKPDAPQPIKNKKPASETTGGPKKKRKKRNAIDEIFGF